MPRNKTAFKVASEQVKASSKAGRLRKALLERIEAHRQDGTIPTSSRFLYYELEGHDDGEGILVSKVRTGARRTDQDLIVALTDLREDGLIGWDEIVDETRSVDCNVRCSSMKEALEAYKQYIQVDPWQLSATRPFVLCESRSLAGVLRSTCNDYGVSLASTNGQSAGFLRTKLAREMNDSSKALHILYCGDWDIGGAAIESNIRTVLGECVQTEFTWERLMITQEQIAKYNLSSIIKTDKRYKGAEGVHEAWECESLSQKTIIELIVERFDEMLQPYSLDNWKSYADNERANLTVVENPEPEAL